MSMNTTLLEDFTLFGKAHIESRDVDPLYPVIAHLIDGWELAEQIEFIHHYCAWYDIVSSLTAWEAGLRAGTADLNNPEHMRLAKMKTGVERRGLRGGSNLLKHLAFQDATVEWEAMECETWEDTEAKIRTIHGNGRWAAYKLSELMQKAVGLPIIPTTMGHGFSSGPRKGLALLFDDAPRYKDQSRWAIRKLDKLSDELLEACPWASDMAVLETVCCDFHSLWKGRYYVGHDIDAMLGSINDQASDPIRNTLMKARIGTLPTDYLGELCGWGGVQKDRLNAYSDKGEVWVR